MRDAVPSSGIRGTDVRKDGGDCRFGTVVLALWPVKPALRLSQLCGCSERHANLLIRGERKPNAAIAHRLFGAIIGDRI
jgi:hypothetical protein